jgi:hypothetical protein
MMIHIIELGAAVGFAATPFKRLRCCSAWSRWVFFTVAGLFLFMGVCGLALDLHYWDFSRHGLSVFRYYMQGIRGFVIGCSFVLLVSGDLVGKKVVKLETVA